MSGLATSVTIHRVGLPAFPIRSMPREGAPESVECTVNAVQVSRSVEVTERLSQAGIFSRQE
jgi:hypothetical protein